MQVCPVSMIAAAGVLALLVGELVRAARVTRKHFLIAFHYKSTTTTWSLSLYPSSSELTWT